MYRQPFDNQCRIEITGTAHGFTTPLLRVQVADTFLYGPALHDIDPGMVQINLRTLDVIVTLPLPASGDVCITPDT